LHFNFVNRQRVAEKDFTHHGVSPGKERIRMNRSIACLIGALLLSVGCVKAPQHVQQTLVGFEATQVLIAAQHAMALEGYDVEKMDVAAGSVTTRWKTRGQGQVQYTVEVQDHAEAGIPGIGITVKADARRKTMDGWTAPQPSTTAELDSVLRNIIDMTVGRFGSTTVDIMATAVAARLPACDATADCEPGTHCASGLCVSECTPESGCATGHQCDTAGRCVPVPEPCPDPIEATNDENTLVSDRKGGRK
jgi:hypothetical protein